jgi:hypothetical protein
MAIILQQQGFPGKLKLFTAKIISPGIIPISRFPGSAQFLKVSGC